ncbi:uncharacterized protein LOC134202852 [Armigeres subalbatus]|uniref:uncharacterized protein LOC134202852 n=1 Tax=Armigeres subalbatus TaxID=124917 RepID=UPI002ED13321
MYVINPANSGKDIPNSYPTNAGSNSNSSSGSGSSTVVGTQEIISKILTKCATMTDAESSSTVNGTATILLSPSGAVRRNQPSAATAGGLVGVSPQSSPASSSSSASSPTADGPYPHSGFQTAAGKDKAKPGGTGSSGSAGGTNGSAGKHGDSSAAGNGTVTGKINGNGTHSGSISAPGGRLQFFKGELFLLCKLPHNWTNMCTC